MDRQERDAQTARRLGERQVGQRDEGAARVDRAHGGEEGGGLPGVEEGGGERVDRGGDRPVVVGGEAQALGAGRRLSGQSSRPA